MCRVILISDSAVDRIYLSKLLKEFGCDVKVSNETSLVSNEYCDFFVFSFKDFKDLESLKELLQKLTVPVLVIGGFSEGEIKELEKTGRRLVFLSRDAAEPLSFYREEILSALKKLFYMDEFSFNEKGLENLDLPLKKFNVSDFKPKDDIKYVLIGASTGGPRLIETIVRVLPETYPYPICVVQHMPADFTSKFAKRLNEVSKLKVVEAEDGEEVIPGKVIIAKGGWHLHFSKIGERVYAKLVPNVKHLFFCPSVDEMFFSAAEVLEPKNVMAVLLTGIGDDGADGMVALRRKGAYTIAESEETAAVYGMPKEAYLRGGAEKVLPFPKIVEEIIKFGMKN